MMKSLTRIIAILFALALAYVGISFASGVGNAVNVTTLALWLLLGSALQLGLFLSTYSEKSWKLSIISAILMLPFFLLVITSVFSPNFLNKLTGTPIQITSSIAFLSGSIIYLYNYYKIFNKKYNNTLKPCVQKAAHTRTKLKGQIGRLARR